MQSRFDPKTHDSKTPSFPSPGSSQRITPSQAISSGASSNLPPPAQIAVGPQTSFDPIQPAFVDDDLFPPNCDLSVSRPYAHKTRLVVVGGPLHGEAERQECVDAYFAAGLMCMAAHCNPDNKNADITQARLKALEDMRRAHARFTGEGAQRIRQAVELEFQKTFNENPFNLLEADPHFVTRANPFRINNSCRFDGSDALLLRGGGEDIRALLKLANKDGKFPLLDNIRGSQWHPGGVPLVEKLLAVTGERREVELELQLPTMTPDRRTALASTLRILQEKELGLRNQFQGQAAERMLADLDLAQALENDEPVATLKALNARRLVTRLREISENPTCRDEADQLNGRVAMMQYANRKVMFTNCRLSVNDGKAKIVSNESQAAALGEKRFVEQRRLMSVYLTAKRDLRNAQAKLASASVDKNLFVAREAAAAASRVDIVRSKFIGSSAAEILDQLDRAFLAKHGPEPVANSQPISPPQPLPTPPASQASQDQSQASNLP